MAKTPSRTIKVYKSYNFITKDPCIDALRTVAEKTKTSDAEIAEKSGVSPSTLYNWFSGPTCRPQFATIEAAARSMGYTFKLVKGKDL